MQCTPHSLDIALLGKIMLARLLTLPLRKFERYVGKAEASAEFAALRSVMMVEQLAGTLTAPQAVPGLLPQPATLLRQSWRRCSATPQ